MSDASGHDTAEFLATTFFKSTGWQFEVTGSADGSSVPGTILLTTQGSDPALGSEGYELTVSTNSVLIRAPAAAGLFYGAQSLLQLFPPEILSPLPTDSVTWSAPCVAVRDRPRFPWRGWMLDSVRHFFNKDEVKQLLDSMALHKLNRFHWHLDDDSGWRIEIRKWPLLTQVGAWRTNILFGLNPKSSSASRDDGRYGGFYSQDDVREIVAYAAQRHIMVVPEIEMPGHSTAALKAYPQFACGCSSCARNYSSIDITNSNASGVFCVARPETMAFLQDVLAEVLELFPGPYVHIGGDEVNSYNWQRHSLDLELMTSLGISSYQAYQTYFTQSIANWLAQRGRTMIGWSEIMNGGLVTNAVLMEWLDQGSSVQAATNRQGVVMSPMSYCYINFVERAGMTWSNEPPSQGGSPITVQTAYAFEPIGWAIPSAYTNYILGVQGNSWAEYIPSLLNMQFKMYPRLCALAEVGWTSPLRKNYAEFSTRLVTHKQRLARMGVNFNSGLTPPVIANWTPAMVSLGYQTRTWDITPNIGGPGELDLSFCRRSESAIYIQWVALLENGVELDRDTHDGYAGLMPSRPAYVLRLPARRPNATYTIAASIRGATGTNSTGVIYRTNWD